MNRTIGCLHLSMSSLTIDKEERCVTQTKQRKTDCASCCFYVLPFSVQINGQHQQSDAALAVCSEEVALWKTFIHIHLRYNAYCRIALQKSLQNLSLSAVVLKPPGC